MLKVAQVVVDVPTMQTNQAYEYAIPKDLRDVIQKGMRVVVPFGTGSRHVQGFVVGFSSEADYSGPLKEIISLMDLEPALNDEMLTLGQDMSQKTYSFLITCYQTMLPSLLRASYEKYIVKEHGIDEESDRLIFNHRKEITWQEAKERKLFSSIKALREEGMISIRYEVKDQRSYKTIRYIRSALSREEIEAEEKNLRANASKQKLLLQALKNIDGQEIKINDLTKQFDLNNQIIYTGRDKGWLEIIERQVYRDPYQDKDFKPTYPLALSQEQEGAYQAIHTAVKQHEAKTFLLQGVTGSGKTEVYMQVIAQVLEQGKTALMLVPEISLTPLMVNRFKARFGDRVAVMHSGLSDGERYDEWRRVRTGLADVVVGARSSVFAPLENIGVIIIDEEHEESYKQSDSPRYHAVNVAKWRSDHHQCPLVLGSATPSLESRARASKGVYQLLEMKTRPTGQTLPTVNIVNLRDEATSGNFGNFSQILIDKMKDRLDKKEQVVLMLNRRGFSSFIMCRDCGFVLHCPSCDIAQTLHMDTRTMKCHYCGHEEAIPRTCPQCRSQSIRYYGTGTQKVESELMQILPEARIIRMDRDTTRRKGTHEKLLEQFGQQEADILLGTQMIAKGLDFPNVTLVGVLNADTSLNLPDFRSSEKTFQLLTQVSGRAGRGERPGEVYVQTYNPEHYAIQLAKSQDYDRFYQYEMKYRHRGQYPPYYFTVRITVSHADEKQAFAKIYELSQDIRPVLSKEAIVLGPSPSSIARTHNKYHYQMIIKYRFEDDLHAKLHEVLEKNQGEVARGLSIIIDPEPRSFM